MATLKERPNGWCTSSIHIKDHRHDKGDGYEDTRHRKSSNKKPKKRAGCIGNNDGAHVYVWTREIFSDTHKRFSNVWGYFFWLSDYEYLVCAGCHRHRNARRRKGVR